jgi:hypothetical protein
VIPVSDKIANLRDWLMLPPEMRRGSAGAAVVLDEIAASHADLLAACEAIDALDCCTGYSFPDSDWPRFWEALEKARAALAKARGKS